jgi:hypothetical protein
VGYRGRVGEGVLVVWGAGALFFSTVVHTPQDLLSHPEKLARHFHGGPVFISAQKYLRNNGDDNLKNHRVLKRQHHRVKSATESQKLYYP